jgi:hypothetical protein
MQNSMKMQNASSVDISAQQCFRIPCMIRYFYRQKIDLSMLRTITRSYRQVVLPRSFHSLSITLQEARRPTQQGVPGKKKQPDLILAADLAHKVREDVLTNIHVLESVCEVEDVTREQSDVREMIKMFRSVTKHLEKANDKLAEIEKKTGFVGLKDEIDENFKPV